MVRIEVLEDHHMDHRVTLTTEHETLLAALVMALDGQVQQVRLGQSVSLGLATD